MRSELMLTRNDLRNLRYLIYVKLRNLLSSARSEFRRFRRKLRAGTLFAKPQPLTPSLLLPLIRNTFPTSIRGSIATEFAKEVEELGAKIEEPFDELVITGGPAHDFVRGFVALPWRLVRQTGKISRYETQAMGFKYIESSKVVDQLWPSWRVDLPDAKRHAWEAQIRAFEATQRMLKGVEEINACLHEAMQTLQ